MATTKRARYRFVVKEAPDFEETHEPRDGVIDIIRTPVTFIVAEPSDRTPPSERPFEGSDFLALDLPPGTSLGSAEEIADFLNNHVQYLSITRFGDAEDAARDVRQSEHKQKIDLGRFQSVLQELRDKLEAEDITGATEALRAVESVVGDVITGWAKSIRISREILGKFGQQDEDLDA
jgi:hypothetical protein